MIDYDKQKKNWSKSCYHLNCMISLDDKKMMDHLIDSGAYHAYADIARPAIHTYLMKIVEEIMLEQQAIRSLDTGEILIDKRKVKILRRLE